MEKQFKSLKQQHDEELFKYILSVEWSDIECEMEDFIFDDGICVKLKNDIVVFIPYPMLPTSFPFPYRPDIKGDIQERAKYMRGIVNLDYAIQENVKHIDFILEHLRKKPDIELGALYLVREDIRLPETTRFRIVKYFRTYPDMLCMGGRESKETTLLVDADDRKALYSAYKKVRSHIIQELNERYEKYGSCAFEIIPYNVD